MIQRILTKVLSVLLLMYVINACNAAEVTSGPKLDSRSMGVGLTKNMTGITKAPDTIVDTNENHQSEIKDLFEVGVGVQETKKNESLDGSSKPSLITLEGGSSAKTTQMNAGVPETFENLNNYSSSTSKPGSNFLPSNKQLNGTLRVPSEGGVLQGQFNPSLEVSGYNMSSAITSASDKLKSRINETKMDLAINSNKYTQSSLNVQRPTNEGVKSLANTEQYSLDLTIGARKGGGFPDSLDPTNNSKDENKEPVTYSSSEMTSIHPQKITPRKGAELPKIYPRKGVLLIRNSSELSSSETKSNDASISTSINTNTGNPAGILNHANISETSNITLQNGKYSLKEEATKYIGNGTQPDVFISSSNTTKTVTPKMQSVGNAEIIPSNSNSNGSVSTTSIESFTLEPNLVDKSGIIASYPSLKKRLKPLKTTDSNSFKGTSIAPEHISSEHDYVIPIVVTILTVPMLVVLALFLYKKGSECWERRHYRRMDFLIDGMYND